jgi:hypothetical protein
MIEEIPFRNKASAAGVIAFCANLGGRSEIIDRDPQNCHDRMLSGRYDLVHFRSRWRHLSPWTRAAAAASGPAFAAIWSNPEDDIYDAL